MATEVRKVSGKSDRGIEFLGRKELICEGGPRGDVPGAGAALGHGLGPTRGWDLPLLQGWPPLMVFWLRGYFL